MLLKGCTRVAQQIPVRKVEFLSEMEKERKTCKPSLPSLVLAVRAVSGSWAGQGSAKPAGPIPHKQDCAHICIYLPIFAFRSAYKCMGRCETWAKLV